MLRKTKWRTSNFEILRSVNCKEGHMKKK